MYVTASPKNIDNTHLILKAIPHRRFLILGSGPRIDPFFSLPRSPQESCNGKLSETRSDLDSCRSDRAAADNRATELGGRARAEAEERDRRIAELESALRGAEQERDRASARLSEAEGELATLRRRAEEAEGREQRPRVQGESGCCQTQVA